MTSKAQVFKLMLDCLDWVLQQTTCHDNYTFLPKSCKQNMLMKNEQPMADNFSINLPHNRFWWLTTQSSLICIRKFSIKTGARNPEVVLTEKESMFPENYLITIYWMRFSDKRLITLVSIKSDKSFHLHGFSFQNALLPCGHLVFPRLRAQHSAILPLIS